MDITSILQIVQVVITPLLGIIFKQNLDIRRDIAALYTKLAVVETEAKNATEWRVETCKKIENLRSEVNSHKIP